MGNKNNHLLNVGYLHFRLRRLASSGRFYDWRAKGRRSLHPRSARLCWAKDFAIQDRYHPFHPSIESSAKLLPHPVPWRPNGPALWSAITCSRFSSATNQQRSSNNNTIKCYQHLVQHSHPLDFQICFNWIYQFHRHPPRHLATIQRHWTVVTASGQRNLNPIQLFLLRLRSLKT